MDLSTPLNAITNYLISHLEKRDLERTLSILSENIAWIGTGESETVHGKESVKRLIAEDIAQTPLGYRVEILKMEPHGSGDICSTVVGKIRVTDIERESIVECRLSAVCIKEEGCFHILVLHKSLPTLIQEQGEYSPISFAEERLRKIKNDFFDSSVPAGLTCCEVSTEMKITYANSYFLDLLGYQSFDELMNLTSGSFRDVVSTAEDIDAIVEEAKIIKETDCKLFTYRLKSKDGQDIWIRDCSRKYIEGDKEFLLCYYIDISDIIKMQNNLKLLSDNIPGGLAVYEYSPKGIRAKYLSDGIFKVIAYPKEEYLAFPKDNYANLVFEEDQPLLQGQIKRLIEEDTDINCTYRIHTKDSGYRWLNLRANSITRDGDKVTANALVLDVTAAKEAEETLRAREKEYQIAIAHCCENVCLYDLTSDTLTMPDELAAALELTPILEDAHRAVCQILIPNQQGLDGYKNFHDKIINGEKTGSQEIPIIMENGDLLWKQLDFVSIFDLGGKPIKAFITVKDTTLQHKINDENQSIRESERLLRIVAAHSDRSIMRYIVESKTIYTDKQTAEKYHLPQTVANVAETLIKQGVIMPESVKEYRKMFDNIHAGKPTGCAKIHMMLFENKPCWLDFKYTIVETDGNKPLEAAISFSDITESHEKELTYKLYRQKIDNNSRRGSDIIFFETDITKDIVEKQGGNLLPQNFLPCSDRNKHLAYIAKNFLIGEEEQQKFRTLFSRENLITMYLDGIRNVQNDWHALLPGSGPRWMRSEIQLIRDPYSQNIKNYTLLIDITEEKNAAIQAQKQAQTDGMTGLYNKTTTETMIKKRLTASKGQPFALLVADMDDLKNINDMLGHAHGDIAISQFANILAAHFRPEDIVGRIGGDEFMVYIEGEPCESYIAELVRKLTNMRVSEKSDIVVHGSFGIVSSATGEDNFDELYKKADKALYHIKRNNKNNYAFYTPEMELPSYKYTGHGENKPQ